MGNNRAWNPLGRTWNPEEKTTWTTPEVAQQIGVSLRQLRHWVKKGYLAPKNTEDGSGYAWVWTREDLGQAYRLVARLEWGLTLEAAARKEDPPLTRTFGRVTFDYW